MKNKTKDVILKVAYFTIPVIQSIAVSVGTYYVIMVFERVLWKRVLGQK